MGPSARHRLATAPAIAGICWLLSLPAFAAAPAPTSTPAAPPAPATTSAAAADPTEGDRTALIVQDMAQHPPQAQIPSQDPAHLQTRRMKLGGLLDRSVRGTENSEVGRVIDVMTDDDGKPAALELDVGGFMGVGNRKIAVAWGLFDLSRTGSGDPLRVALSAAQVRSAPEADASGELAVVTGAAPLAAAAVSHPNSATTPPADTPAEPPKPADKVAPATPPAPAPAPAAHPDHPAAPTDPAGKGNRP